MGLEKSKAEILKPGNLPDDNLVVLLLQISGTLQPVVARTASSFAAFVLHDFRFFKNKSGKKAIKRQQSRLARKKHETKHGSRGSKQASIAQPRNAKM